MSRSRRGESEERFVTITIRLPVELKGRMNTCRKLVYKSKSEFIRDAILRYCQKIESKKPLSEKVKSIFIEEGE
jgi:predicted DNA-binding protein